MAAAQAAQALVDQPKSAELVKKLLDTLPENHKKTFLLETLDRKMNPEIPARTIVAAFKFQSPREWGLHLGRELVSEIQERRRRAEERKVDEEQQRADKAKARTAARSTSPSTAARSTSPSTAPSAPKKRPEQSPAPTVRPSPPAAHHDPGHGRDRPTQQPEPQPRAAERHVQVLDTDDTVLAELPSPAAPRQPEVEQPTVKPKQSNRGRDR